MRILIVSNMFPSSKFQSYGVFVKNFCAQLQDIGIDYSLSVMKKSSNKVSKLFRYIFFYVKTYIKCMFFNYDLIYVHYASNSSVPVLWAAKLKKMKVYTNVHGSDVAPQNEKQEKMQKYTRRIFDISEKIIVPSFYFKDFVSEKYCISEEKIYVSFSGGIDSNVFYPEDIKFYSSKFTLGFVSRISYGKGWDVFLKACARVKELDFKIIMVGSGPQDSELKQLIYELELTDRIEMYPLLCQQELREIYKELDVFVFSTCLRESLGLVAIEAMACGVPVIATDFAAPSYYVVDNMNGYKFNKGDDSDLAKKIRQFSKLSSEEREQLRQGAINTAEKYKKEYVLLQMKDILVEEKNDKD